MVIRDFNADCVRTGNGRLDANRNRGKSPADVIAQIGYLVDPYTGRGPDFKHGYNWARRNPDQLSLNIKIRETGHQFFASRFQFPPRGHILVLLCGE